MNKRFGAYSLPVRWLVKKARKEGNAKKWKMAGSSDPACRGAPADDFHERVRVGHMRIRYCSHARCIENGIYVIIAGCVGNLPSVQNLDIHYAQSAVLTPSDIPFQRDGVAAECAPNIETMIFQDLDLRLLKTHRSDGSVLTWLDRRSDLYKISYKEEEKDDIF